MKKFANKKGFTLIELIVYIAIASVVLVSAVNVGWNLINANASVQSKQEVYMNARLVVNQFGIKIREAEDVIAHSSAFGSHPGALALDYPGGNTNVILDTYTKNITVGGQSVTILKLRTKEGNSAYVDLTTDEVDVTNFVLTNLTRGSESDNINVELTLEKANPGDDSDYDAVISLETAISIRE